MKTFTFNSAPSLLFGREQFKQLGNITKEFGDKALITCTGSRRYVDDAIKILSEKDIEVKVFDKVVPNPTVSGCDVAAKIAKDFGAQVIIGIGGGSAIDSAKAVAVTAAMGGSSWDYLFFKTQPDSRTLPVIAVTTTSGTGSHVTPYAVISKLDTREKSAIANPLCIPRKAICDPEMMLSVPKRTTIETGFDVFAHSFESYTNKNANPMTDLVAFESLKLVMENLNALIDDLNNIELREKLALADTYAGMAITNAGTTVPHAMGQPISALNHDVAHGHSLMIVYPPFLKYSAEHAPEKFIKVGKLIDSNVSSATDAADKLVEWIQNFGLETRMSQVGIKEEDIDDLMKQCLAFPDWRYGPAKVKKKLKDFYMEVL
ncbi:MAG: iron-containing alcohol dehydrogenase [Promethearchaeota archaeon]